MGWLRRSRGGLRSRVEEVLGALGEEPGVIARQLEQMGVKGTPRLQEGCAIALYLSAVVAADPAVNRLRVGQDRVVISTRRRCRPRVTVKLSAPLKDFILRFDAGCYPELTLGYPQRGAGLAGGPSAHDGAGPGGTAA